jgi:hypothetical protein
VLDVLRYFERVTRPVDPLTKEMMSNRWSELPDKVRTRSQAIGRHGVGCEGTHGVFPRCNFACSPCYHSASANRVRTDGEHTISEVAKQMSFLERVRGPRAHAQLIGGEVSLLEPEDHARAIQVMRSHGREPMSMTHGDFSYEYLLRFAVDEEGKRRFKRVSFAAHFDTTMVGRKGMRVPEREIDLYEHRREFAKMFQRLKKEHGVRYFLAHNMTVTPSNVGQIKDVLKDCQSSGYNMFSFQPAAFIGNEKRWKEDYREFSGDEVWRQIENAIGTHLTYSMVQVGDVRCNRTAWGYFVGDRWYSVFDEDDPDDELARDAFYSYLGGVHFNAPPLLLALRLTRVILTNPTIVRVGLAWLVRRVKKAGGLSSIVGKKIVPMTFVMHSFMDASQVMPAWELLERGVWSEDPEILATQERLKACSYAMAHPEMNRVVPACVQHSVFDPQENIVLESLLPLPKRVVKTGVLHTDEAEARGA